MADEAPQQRKGREGSRWINERPSGDDVAEWFKETVTLPEGLDHGKYVSGVTLIPNEEKSKEVYGFRDNGSPIINEVTNLVFTPYVKVETRVQFFHDYMAQHRDEWEGVISPVVPKEQDPSLPPGFFWYAIRLSDTEVSRFICCSMKVTVFKRGDRKIRQQLVNTVKGSELHIVQEGETIIDAPPATKMIGVRGRFGADQNALMKAETGAVGRALGLAGMLVVPGSGVATAEDMADAGLAATSTQEAGGGGETAQIASADAPESLSDEDLKARATALIGQLQEEKPEKHKEFLAWAKEREMGRLSDLESAGLRGIIKKVEKLLDAGS